MGTWNVRTLYEAGGAMQVVREMKNYGIPLLGLCETRWTESGQKKLSSGEVILYSGHEENIAPYTEGVAFVLSLQEPVNSSII